MKLIGALVQVPSRSCPTQCFRLCWCAAAVLTLIGAVQALGMPPHALDDTIGSVPNMQMKIAKYPPARPGGEGEGSGGFYGVGPHSDSGYLSILLQVYSTAPDGTRT